MAVLRNRFTSAGVEHAGVQAEAQILVETDAQIGFALRLEERVQHAHLALVVRAFANGLVGDAPQLAIGRDRRSAAT